MDGVVAHHVPVAFLRIELDGKVADIALGGDPWAVVSVLRLLIVLTS